MPLYDETEIDDGLTEEEAEGGTEDTGTEDTDVADRVKRLEEKQVYDQVIADPDVQRVLELKKTGKAVTVGEMLEEKKTTKDEFEIDDDDPAAELLKRISTVIDKKLNGIVDRVGVIEGFAQRAQGKEVNVAIEDCKGKHQDFDTYKDQMITLSNENPGLNVEELYTMAKMRAGKLNINEPSTFSEKGTTQPRRSMKQAGATTPRGRQGFNAIVRKALKGLDLDSLE